MRKNKITVIGGAGHIGLPLSIVFANKGFDVAVLDKNKSAMEIAKKGIMPFREKDGVKWCFTLDAGANVHFLYPQADQAAAKAFIEEELAQYCENGAFIHDDVGMGAERL